jgi:hypothetical protein
VGARQQEGVTPRAGDRVRAYDPWLGEEVIGTVTRVGAVETIGGAVRLFVWTTDSRHTWIDPRNVREVLQER